MKKLCRQSILHISAILILFFASGCREVFEEDITGKSVSINSPEEGAVNSIYKQLFWWNKLDGATQYAIQIVTPSFDSVASIVADTILVDADKYYKTLEPGQYQWRIRAENGYYKTKYQTYTLTMLQSSLDQQTVTLISPANNTYAGIGEQTVDFSWEAVPGATKYLIQLDTVTGNFGTGILLNEEVTENIRTYPFTTSGDYKWRIKAMDDEGNSTNWSSIWKTGYYGTAPAAPNPVSPADNTPITSLPYTINFTWDEVTGAKTYTLNIYRHTGAGEPNMSAESSEKYIIEAPALSKMVTVESDDTTPGMKIYWRISATDKAGNTGPMSTARNLTVQ